MSTKDYWQECISEAASECGMTLTDEQLASIAEAVQGGHENYGMAFYSPPSSDRIAVIGREWQEKIDKLQRELDGYRHNAEKAIKQALRLHHDDLVTIGEHGDVFRHGGRNEQVQ